MDEWTATNIYWAGAAALLSAGLAVAIWWLSGRPWRGARTRYPIVLAHGLFGFGSIRVGKVKQDYFKGIVDHLQALGIEVHTPRVPLAASISVRARALADAVEAVPGPKVNLVAHSMGGLDARYAISKLGLGRRVASLTTIGTPHHGTPIADAGAGLAGKLGLKGLLSSMGMAAFAELTTEHMSRFNSNTPNARTVRYASVVASVGEEDPIHALLLPTHAFLRQGGHDSDGLVPIASQSWGKPLWTIRADHWAQIGRSTGLDAPATYERVARQLRRWGC